MPRPLNSDAALVRSVRSGNTDAFEALVHRHQKKAHAIAHALHIPSGARDDVVQESFLQAFRDLRRLRRASRFVPWFLAIVRNSARGFHRRRARTVVTSEVPEASVSSPDRLEGGELREQVRLRVEQLPDGIREAIFLYYYEGQSTEEVARALGITRSAVKKRLQNGRGVLREKLWRELEESLRDMLPDARTWKQNARTLALVAASCLPIPGTSGAASAAAASSSESSGAGSVPGTTRTGLLMGGLVVSGKKIIVTTTAALLLFAFGAILMTESEDPVEEPRPSSVLAPAPAPSAEPRSDEEQTPIAGLVEKAPAEPEPSVAFRVSVVGEEGESLPDAAVRATWFGRREGDGGPVYTIGRSTPLEPVGPGDFAVREIEDEAVILIAAAPLYEPRVVEQELPPGGLREAIVIQLEPGEPVHFRLVDPTLGDRPVAGATIGPLVGMPLPNQDRFPAGYWPAGLDATTSVKRLYRVLSDEEGRFTVASPPGRFWITRKGYGPTALNLSGVGRDPDATYAVPLYPPTTLRIAVRHEDGEPVDGFQYGVSNEPGLARGMSKRVEGSEVVHELFVLCYMNPHSSLADTVEVGVRSGDVEVREQRKIQYGAENLVEIVLEPRPASIRGHVLDPDGAPVSDALVAAHPGQGRIYITDDDLRQFGGRTVRTGADGSYELSFTTLPGPLYLLVQHSDQPFHISEPLRLRPNESLRHDIELPRPAAITATLAKSLSEQTGAAVTLSNERMLEWPLIIYRKKLETDRSGRARFLNVHEGCWTVSWMEGRMIRRSRVTVRPGQEYEITLGGSADDVVELHGFLVCHGEPVEGMDLRLMNGSTSELISLSTSDAAGMFRFDAVPPGTHPLTVGGHQTPEFPLHYFTVTVGRETEPLRLDLSTTTLTGRVASEGRPLDTVSVKPYTRQQPIESDERLVSFHAAETDAGGWFRLSGVYQLPALLVFEKEGYRSRSLEWVPTGDVEIELPEIELRQLTSEEGVKFRVVEAESGEEIPKALVKVLAIGHAAPRLVERLSRKTLEDDLVTKPLVPGRYRAFVRPGDLGAQQYTSEAVEFVYAGGTLQEVTIPSRRGGSAVLELATERGAVPAASVEVLDEGGAPRLNWRGTRKLQFQGSASLLGLPPGPLNARVTAPGWKTLEFSFEVTTDSVKRIVKVIERE